LAEIKVTVAEILIKDIIQKHFMNIKIYVDLTNQAIISFKRRSVI